MNLQNLIIGLLAGFFDKMKVSNPAIFALVQTLLVMSEIFLLSDYFTEHILNGGSPTWYTILVAGIPALMAALGTRTTRYVKPKEQ